jgi:hypothetical protein
MKLDYKWDSTFETSGYTLVLWTGVELRNLLK